jgi:hypothetical protein
LDLDLHYFMQSYYLRDLCWDLGLALCSTQLSTQVPKPHLQKVLSCSHPCHARDLGLGTPCVVGKSRFPCSQRLRLYILTSCDLGPCVNWPSSSYPTNGNASLLRAALHLEAGLNHLEADCMKFQPFLGWRSASTTHYNRIITGANFPICKGLRAKKLGQFNKSSIIQRI